MNLSKAIEIYKVKEGGKIGRKGNLTAYVTSRDEESIIVTDGINERLYSPLIEEATAGDWIRFDSELPKRIYVTNKESGKMKRIEISTDSAYAHADLLLRISEYVNGRYGEVTEILTEVEGDDTEKNEQGEMGQS